MMTSPSLTTPSTNAPDSSSGPLGTDTVSLLRQNYPRLVEHWANSLSSIPGSSYCSRPIEELQDTCGECLKAYIVLLEDEDSGPLWNFIERICEMRASLYFPPSDLTEAFLLFLESAEIVLGPMTGPGESFVRMMRDLRGCTRLAIRSFVNTYLIHLDLAQSSLGSL